MREFRKWTADEVETLKTMLDAGARYAAIAKVLGRTEGSVSRKACDAGLVIPEPSVRAVIPKPVTPRNTSTLTAFILGDPPPGRSALDQRGLA